MRLFHGGLRSGYQFLALCGLFAVSFSEPAGAASASATPAPLLSVLEPKVNYTYQNGAPVHAMVEFGAGANVSTFQAHVNGTDVTSLFYSTNGCGAGAACKEANLPATALLTGTNILIANASGPNESTGAARAKFQYAGPSASTDPVSRLLPGVAVQAVKLANSQDPNNIDNYQIVVGPGPGFPARIYTAANLNCSAGLNSVQVLVLHRKTLEPEEAVGGNNPGQACFGDAGSLNTFLTSLPAGDLVITNSFLGLMPNLNTTAIGGTNYSGSPITPNYYNAIGVAGAPPGTAYESYQPIHPIGPAYLAPLTGSLMLDINQNYFFVSSLFKEVEVIPNDPAFPGNRTSTVLYGGEPFSETLPAGANGGFYLFLVDRQLGYVQSQAVFATNSSSAEDSLNALHALSSTLLYAPREYLVFLTTIGVPFSSSTLPDHDLYHALNELGGNGYLPQKLVAQPDGNPPAYTLIGCKDEDYQAGGNVIENSSLWSAQKETGEIKVLMARDRKNRWYPQTGMSDWAAPGQPSRITWQWQEVSYQQAQDWPAWTAGQQMAYQDLTAYNSYPIIGYGLGCNSSPTQVCQPIRSYYDAGVGGNGSAPPIVSVNYHNLAYRVNTEYTLEDFNAVITQLAVEQGYLRNLYQLYNLFRALTSEESGNLSAQLSTVATNIDGSLKHNDPRLVTDRLARSSAVTAVMSIIPGVGPAFGVVSAILGGTAVFLPAPSGVPDGGYGVTLHELINKTQKLGTGLANTTDTLFTSMTNDWGKMKIIGEGYGTQTPPWYMCTTCVDSNVPRAAMPAIALGAKRDFYLQLLPLVYSLDALHGQTAQTPKGVGGWVTQFVGNGTMEFCFRAYSGAPDDSWLTYNNMTSKSTRDFFIITQTTKTDPPVIPPNNRPKVIHFPSDSLLNDLFNEPAINNDTLGGGAGIIKEQLLPERSVLPARAGEIANGRPCS